MPYPKAGESKSAYVSRFMGSSEAQTDFPDEKQRLAVAYSMFSKRENSDEMVANHPWPKKYICNFIEPGVVFYQDLGECAICKNDQTCEEKLGKPCDTPGEMVLVTQEALAKMAKSFVGKPVIDVIHKDVKSDTVANGEADGIVTRVWFDPATAWWMCEFLVWNPETQEHCESLAYSVSCAYDPTDVAGGGQYHSAEYQEEVKDGEYTHLAVVTNPRYERARITLSNSKGGSMFEGLKFWKKGERKNAASVDPKEMINVDGKPVPLHELVAALPEEPKPAEPKFNDDTSFETSKGTKTLAELKQAYRNKMKNAAPELCPSCKGSGKKASENAAVPEGEPTPLPDMRDPKQNVGEEAPKPNLDEAEAAAKKLNVGEEAPKPNLDEAEAAAKKLNVGEEAPKPNLDEAEAAARKNAEDETRRHAEEEAAKKAKEDDTKKNAEDETRRHAAEEERKAEERRNSGKAAFTSLRNAAQERHGEPVRPTLVTVDDRLAAGAARYGSAKK